MVDVISAAFEGKANANVMPLRRSGNRR